MNKTLKILIILLTVLISEGILAGEIKLTDFNGSSSSISDYAGKGKWLVVMLWASDCTVCNREAHNYVDFHQQHQEKDAQVLGISLDGEAKKPEAQTFIKRHKVNFPNLIGESMSVAQMYRERTGNDWIGTPSFMVFNPKGELLGAQAGAVPVSVIESFIEREKASAKQPAL